jgi:hypothetical protein
MDPEEKKPLFSGMKKKVGGSCPSEPGSGVRGISKTG